MPLSNLILIKNVFIKNSNKECVLHFAWHFQFCIWYYSIFHLLGKSQSLFFICVGYSCHNKYSGKAMGACIYRWSTAWTWLAFSILYLISTEFCDQRKDEFVMMMDTCKSLMAWIMIILLSYSLISKICSGNILRCNWHCC